MSATIDLLSLYELMDSITSTCTGSPDASFEAADQGMTLKLSTLNYKLTRVISMQVLKQGDANFIVHRTFCDMRDEWNLAFKGDE